MSQALGDPLQTIEKIFAEGKEWFYGLESYKRQILARKFLLERQSLASVAEDFRISPTVASRIEASLRADFPKRNAFQGSIVHDWLQEHCDNSGTINFGWFVDRFSPDIGGSVIAYLLLEELGWQPTTASGDKWTFETNLSTTFTRQLDWASDLSDRDRRIISRHMDNKKITLTSIGAELGLTRERIRQIDNAARKEFLKNTTPVDAEFHDWLRRKAGEASVVFFDDVLQCLSPESAHPWGSLVLVLWLRQLGWEAIDDRQLYWSIRRSLVKVIDEIEPTGPVEIDSFLSISSSRGIPDGLIEVFQFSFGSLIKVGTHFVREKEEKTDRVHLFLLSKRTAQTEEIMEHLGSPTKHSLEGFLRRKPEFVRLGRSRGGWGLASTFNSPKFRSALPAVLSILESEGPQDYSALVQKMAKLHPVSIWRLNQVLEDHQIGSTRDGKIGLVRQGAVKTESAPNRPVNMSKSGAITGVTMTVDQELMRGSGLSVHKWMGWSLGLKHPPESMTFRPDDPEDDLLVVRRTGSGTSMTTLRHEVSRRGLNVGCRIALLVNVESLTWNLRHACDSGTCAEQVP